jgi:predicted ATPase/DNA-binding SARP family transcriptional activator/Tfp pilus assembly protein PilF
MTRLLLSLLGPFQAVLDGEPIADFATDKTRALLAYLAVETDHPHRRDTLAGLLWPDQPERKARQNLRQALSYLRQAIGDPGDDDSAEGAFLLVDRQTVQFNPDSDYWLDVAAFKALADDCKKHRHSRLGTCLSCMQRLERMAELYRGGFLEHFFLSDSSMFEEWASLEREWLHRQAVETLSHLADYYERRGDYARARQYAWRQVELEPWREEAHRHLMRLLTLDGQRSAALVQYETCRRALAEELGVKPANETMALYERIQAEEFLHSLAIPHNLPSSLPHLVGREKELAELADMLADPDCRLVTLVGPGGIGKTHLALQTALNHIGTLLDGTYFVSLISISSTALVVPTIADTLRFSFYSRQDMKEQLLNYLQEKEILLVLDNMEHVLDAESVGLLADILRRAPGVVLLVTSRERLNLQGEWVYQVEGLTYPRNGDARELDGYSAVELFLQRACQMERHFALSENEAPHAVRICQMVEGIPLGVELAAAWVQTRSCKEIAQEIEHNLDVLTTRLHGVTERHQSIRATFEHSWQLLSPAEKDLLARLSVFQGGFQWEAASAIAEASLSTLSALLDKSLIRRISPDRYDMHALLKQYAAEKLGTVFQEQERTEDRHARYFTAFMEQQAELLQGAEQKRAFQEIASEIENVRRAWQLAVARGYVHEVEQSLESLYHFYDVRCRFQEGVDLLAQAIERWRGDTQQMDIFGRVLARQGVLYRHLGLYQQAANALEQSLEIFERLQVQTELIFCLINLADVLRNQGKHQALEQLVQKSLDLSRQTRNHWGISRSFLLLGLVQFRIGNIDQAKVLFEESLATGRESRNPRLVTSPLSMLGDVACHQGNYDKAQAMFDECLSLSRELGDKFGIAVHLNNLGTVQHLWERYPEARAYYQESLDICRQIGDLGGQAVALSNLGEVAFALDVYSESRRFFREGLSIGRNIQDQWTIMVCLNNLGEIACTVEDCKGAKAYFAEALKIATETQTLAVLSKILVNVAVLFAKQGQTDRAAALLELARRHPASEQMDQEKATRLLDEMGLDPPDDVPESLEAVVAEVLAEIAPDTLQSG